MAACGLGLALFGAGLSAADLNESGEGDAAVFIKKQPVKLTWLLGGTRSETLARAVPAPCKHKPSFDGFVQIPGLQLMVGFSVQAVRVTDRDWREGLPVDLVGMVRLLI